MNTLFYDLIHTVKTKRWFVLLDQLEEQSVSTAGELAKLADCTIRTVQVDAKEIKRYFGQTIRLMGDDEGHHLSLLNPSAYIKKKQTLLDQEPLFFFADQLVQDSRRTNQEWAAVFSVSPASFGRMKRVFVKMLEEQYHLKIVGKDNRLQGEEAAIRQFMYDFYFTLPSYPKIVEQKTVSLPLSMKGQDTGDWVLDPVRLNQWNSLASMRINQGHCLPSKVGQEEIQARLAEAIPLSMPPQERAALFLLAVKEEQFLNPLRQKEFIRQFSPERWNSTTVIEFDHVAVRFFETFIFLMHHFFQLPVTPGQSRRIGEPVDEQLFLKQLMKRYLESKQKLERSLRVSFKLTGPLVLQKWIKKSVRQHLNQSGYYLVEEDQATLYTRQLVVTNDVTQCERPQVVFLSSVPEEGEIEQVLHAHNW